MEDKVMDEKADKLIGFLKRKVRRAMPGISEEQMWDMIIDIIHRAQEAFEREPSRQTRATLKRFSVINK